MTPESHDGIVEDWRQHAESHDDANYAFLRSLKFRKYGFDPDQAARELHEQAFRIVDCTRCANCCKTMGVILDAADVDRIARHLGLSIDEFEERYVERDEEQPAVVRIRQRPCPFLGADDRCTIYEVRPTVCREYPHTDKEGFATRTIGHASNAQTCPAVFWIVERLRERASRRRKSNPPGA